VEDIAFECDEFSGEPGKARRIAVGNTMTTRAFPGKTEGR
jgi:hypothetical protein